MDEIDHRNLDWSMLLKHCRVDCVTSGDIDQLDNRHYFFKKYSVYFDSLALLLDDYLIKIINVTDEEKAKRTQDERNNLKELIQNTRNAMRLAQICMASSHDSMQISFQNKAVTSGVEKRVVVLLSSSKIDSKTRLYAARLLCNTVTSNAATADAVASCVSVRPSEAKIASSMLESIVDGPAMNGNKETLEHDISFVDMIIASADNRDALGALVACLHNIIIALYNGENSIHMQVATDPLLMSTIMRRALSVNSVTQTNHQNSLMDPATEWILFLVTKLSRFGLLPEMYKAVGGRSLATVVPEQIVLLHCLQNGIDESSKTISPPEQLGGDIGLEKIIESHLFLAEVFSSVRGSLKGTCDDTQISFANSALLKILDILADTLSLDNKLSTQIRESLGRNTSFMQEMLFDLGNALDILFTRNEGCKVRDMIINTEEEHLITSLVRVIGNICFQCRHNQDLMRSTAVPMRNNAVSPRRNGLHLLLTCTSYSYVCFMLREWAIIAIRNALQDNELNQAEVAKLEAQQPAQSPALDRMGIRVDVDRFGKVSITPIEEEDKEGQNKAD